MTKSLQELSGQRKCCQAQLDLEMKFETKSHKREREVHDMERIVVERKKVCIP